MNNPENMFKALLATLAGTLALLVFAFVSMASTSSGLDDGDEQAIATGEQIVPDLVVEPSDGFDERLGDAAALTLLLVGSGAIVAGAGSLILQRQRLVVESLSN